MFTNEELMLIYELLCQCQYGQVKDLCLKIENEIKKTK